MSSNTAGERAINNCRKFGHLACWPTLVTHSSFFSSRTMSQHVWPRSSNRPCRIPSPRRECEGIAATAALRRRALKQLISFHNADRPLSGTRAAQRAYHVSSLSNVLCSPPRGEGGGICRQGGWRTGPDVHLTRTRVLDRILRSKFSIVGWRDHDMARTYLPFAVIRNEPIESG